MCFSATASFTAGTALVAVGSLTLRASRTSRELPLALIPVLFGAQQLTEGVLWVSLRHDLPWLATSATYVFSVFSHTLWPILVPLAVLLVEVSRPRQRVLGVVLAAGLAVGLYLLLFILRFPVTARIQQHHIAYDSPHFFLPAVLLLYLIATGGSPMLSSHRCIRVFGVLALVLAVIAYQVSARTFVSVWCFFAAVLSLLVYLHFSGPMQARRDADRATQQAPA